MFKHEKQLLKDVRVDKCNPNYANLMQEAARRAARRAQGRSAIPVTELPH